MAASLTLQWGIPLAAESPLRAGHDWVPSFGSRLPNEKTEDVSRYVPPGLADWDEFEER